MLAPTSHGAPSPGSRGNNSSTQLNYLVAQFFAYLRRCGKAPRTAERWQVELDRFVAWVGDGELAEIDSAALELPGGVRGRLSRAQRTPAGAEFDARGDAGGPLLLHVPGEV